MTEEQEIPSAFVRQDTRTTDADQYINVHDVQTAYKNFNALIAKRARYPMITAACVAIDDSGSPVEFDGWGPLQVSNLGNRLGPWPVWVPPYTKALDLRVRAATNSVGNFYLYPMVHPVAHGSATQQISEDVKITVSATSETEHNASIPVPSQVQQAGLAWLTIFYVGVMDASPEAGEVDILDAGYTYVGTSPARLVGWFDSTDSLAVGLILVCSNADVLPLRIDFKQTITGGFRYTMSDRWSEVPTTSDTFLAHGMSQLSLYSITCTPARITSFGASLSSGV
jgi:hypothetical protein